MQVSAHDQVLYSNRKLIKTELFQYISPISPSFKTTIKS